MIGLLSVTFQDRQTRDTADAHTFWMIPIVYIWRVVGRMCTWDIVDFFRAGIQQERKASISKVRRITGRSLATVLVLMYMIWSRI